MWLLKRQPDGNDQLVSTVVEQKVSRSMPKTGIDYGDKTWNTIVGCRHNCPWDCWAKKLTTTRLARLYGGNFEDIVFMPERLPQVMQPATKPSKSPNLKEKEQMVLVNFEGDMWGEWVESRWIRMVLDWCEENEHNKYMFLTKNPNRYMRHSCQIVESLAAKNMWFGTSISGPEDFGRVANLPTPLIDHGCHMWLSIEPLLHPFEDDALNDLDFYLNNPRSHYGIEWVVIGALTGKGGKQPEPEWVEMIIEMCSRHGVPYFLKDNLKGYEEDKHWPEM